MINFYSHLWKKYQEEENSCEYEDTQHKYPSADIDVVCEGKVLHGHQHNCYARNVDNCCNFLRVSETSKLDFSCLKR